MDPEKHVAEDDSAETTQRIEGRLWQIVKHLAEEGSDTIEPGSKPRQVMEDLLDVSLQLMADIEMARNLTPSPMICPLCLTPSAIVPLLTDFGPVWIETGHVGDCPVHKRREELALARRDRWRKEHGEGGLSLDSIKSMFGGAQDRRKVDDWLRIATEFEANLPPRMKFNISETLPEDQGEGSRLDEGILTPEARVGYARIRNKLLEFAANRKPTQIPLRGGFLDAEAGRDGLRLVRALPDPDVVTALQVKAIFHEIVCGALEWSYHIEDAHFPMHEYAHIALGRRMSRFTAEELQKLKSMEWTKPMLVLKNYARSTEATDDRTGRAGHPNESTFV